MHNLFRGLYTYVDKVLESVIAKGSGELLSLDLSTVPNLLTDHALSVISKLYHVNKCCRCEKIH